MKVGWYSPTMAEISGTAFWESPDGDVIEVTTVTENYKHNMVWQDLWCCGLVESFVSEGRRGDGFDDIVTLF